MPLLLFLIAVAMHWKLVLTRQYTLLDSPDLVYQVLPWYAFQAREWHQGRFPLWDPHLWTGQPLLAQAVPGAAQPLNWLLFWLPLRNGHVRVGFVHWYFVIIYYLGALSFYLLCRDLKRSRSASLLAACFFAFAGYYSYTTWPQMLHGAMWAPLVLLFLFRVLRGESRLVSAALSGACLGISFLGGHHQIPMFVALAAAGLWIYHFAVARAGRFKILQSAFIFLVFTLFISGLQTIPMIEYGKLSLRWVGTPEPVGWSQTVPDYVHQNFRLLPATIIGLVIPGILDKVNLFVGFAGISLALVGLIHCWSDRMIRALSAVGLAALLYGFAGQTLFHGLLYSLVPGLEKARSPCMAIIMFHIPLCCLIAYGIDAYLSNRDAAKRLVYPLAGVAGLILATLVVLALSRPFAADQNGLVTVAALAALLLAGLFASGPSTFSRRTAFVLLFGVSLIEVSNSRTHWYGRRDNPDSFLKKTEQFTEIAEFLRTHARDTRVDVDAEIIPYNFGDWHGIDTSAGYLASVTENRFRLPYNAKTRELLGVGYRVGTKWLFPGVKEVFRTDTGLSVFQYDKVMPLAWSVHEVRGAKGRYEADKMLADDGIDVSKIAFVPGTPPPVTSCDSSDQVRLVHREPGRWVVDADMRCKGMVVVNETFYPGWQANIDGAPAPIYEAYGALRGVVVDSGRHRVEMRFRPKSVYAGASMTLAGFLAAAFLLLRQWKRS